MRADQTTAPGPRQGGGLLARLERSAWLRLAARVGVLAAALGVYTLLLALDGSLRRSLPTIPALVRAIGTVLTGADFYGDLGYTLAITLVSLAMSVLIGVAAGLLLSIHRHAYTSAAFVLDFMRTIPPLALIPVGLLTLGPTTRMEITLILLAAVWPVVIQVRYGVANIDRRLLETARSYRVPLGRRLAYVTAPALGPTLATAVRLSATLCLLVAFGTELLASGNGLGYLVASYQQANRPPEVYAAILAVGLLGVLVNVTLLAAERRLFAWRRQAQS